jgi:hypothetical protein
MSRVEAWLASQKAILAVDSSHADKIALEGPDGNIWGKWPVGLPELVSAIEQAITTIGEELPSGRHACKLIAIDAQGAQVSVMPRIIHGKSSAAATAASETRALQQATSNAIRNNEEQVLGLRNENERLRARLDEEMAVKFDLLDKLSQVAYATHDLALREKTAEQKHEIWKELIEKMGPGLEVLGGAIAQKGLELFAVWEQKTAETEEATRAAKARAAAVEKTVEGQPEPKQVTETAEKSPQENVPPQEPETKPNGKRKRRAVRQPAD